ncbi:MAG: isoprenylcysteine carboxylmethyltransferase family protein [bacterium]|nr:isoprenylcysteine carboxylmethyltransferase family protein [bacterium]
MARLKKRLTPRLLAVYAAALAAIWFSEPTPGSLALGLLPILAGESLRLWATGHLHKNDNLTVTGPFAYVRHPLYLGTFLIAVGFLIMAGNSWAYLMFTVLLLVFFVYYMPYKDRIESARLESLYGDAYRRFAIAVPRLLPRLHPYEPLEADRGSETAWRMTRFADNNETGTALAVTVGMVAMALRWGLG